MLYIVVMMSVFRLVVKREMLILETMIQKYLMMTISIIRYHTHRGIAATTLVL